MELSACRQISSATANSATQTCRTRSPKRSGTPTAGSEPGRGYRGSGHSGSPRGARTLPCVARQRRFDPGSSPSRGTGAKQNLLRLLWIRSGVRLTAASKGSADLQLGFLGAGFDPKLVAGTLMNTAQSSLPALAAAFYPTHGRATGVAWMLGFGRFGGSAGSFLVGELSRRTLSFGEIFTILAVPGLISAVALLVKPCDGWGEALSH